jgi:GGDEF domain-containing protein
LTADFAIEIQLDVPLPEDVKGLLTTAVTTTLHHQQIPPPAELTLLLTDDKTIRHLNHDFRQVDAPTDVLSFPDGDIPPGMSMPYLGDIAISANADGLRLCSQVRSLERTRHLPILMIVEPSDDARLLRGLDMGVNDYVLRPIERHELMARVRTQVKRKRHSDLLKARLEESVEMAITDGLTGLHNRRYMEGHLKTLVAQSIHSGRSLSLLVADIDFFKSVNDTYGHDAGDNVLREFAQRFRRNTRGIDLACRLGGEEFVIIMPDTDLARAIQVGERLRATIAA